MSSGSSRKRGGVTTLRGIDAVLEWYAGGGAARRGSARGSRRPRECRCLGRAGRPRGFRRWPSRLAQSIDLYVEGIGRSRIRENGPARLHGARREDRSLRAREPRRVRSRGRSRPLTAHDVAAASLEHPVSDAPDVDDEAIVRTDAQLLPHARRVRLQRAGSGRAHGSSRRRGATLPSSRRGTAATRASRRARTPSRRAAPTCRGRRRASSAGR